MPVVYKRELNAFCIPGSLCSNTSALRPGLLFLLSFFPQIAARATVGPTPVASRQQALRALTSPPASPCSQGHLAHSQAPSPSCVLLTCPTPVPSGPPRPTRPRAPAPCLPPPPSPAAWTPGLCTCRVPVCLATATHPGLHPASQGIPATPTPPPLTSACGGPATQPLGPPPTPPGTQVLSKHLPREQKLCTTGNSPRFLFLRKPGPRLAKGQSRSEPGLGTRGGPEARLGRTASSRVDAPRDRPTHQCGPGGRWRQFRRPAASWDTPPAPR